MTKFGMNANISLNDISFNNISFNTILLNDMIMLSNNLDSEYVVRK
ncbi:hypothetical protein SH2C18_27450 [Clostridium sediminicola]